MKWIVAVPIWGDWYADRFARATLPALRRAMDGFSGHVHLVIHTDREREILGLVDDISAEIWPVPPTDHLIRGSTESHQSQHRRFALAHQHAYSLAEPGDRFVGHTADMVVSAGIFAACERRFAEGRMAMVMAASRTVGEPPIGAAPAELLDWSMRHPHQMILDCFWGGSTEVPWAVYFRSGDSVVLRGLHLHAFAVVKKPGTAFSGTADADMIDAYQPSEIHVVTGRDEIAAVETSPPDRRFKLLSRPFDADYVARWGATRASPTQWWLSSHRIRIAGDGDPGDEALWDSVVAAAPPWARRAYHGALQPA